MVSRILVVTLVLLALFAAPAAADNPFPLGKKSVPPEFQSLMRKPIGISFTSFHVTETMDVSNFAVVLGGQALPQGAISFLDVRHMTHVNSVRADLWVLPFLNVYGVVGKSTGQAKDLTLSVAPGVLPQGVTIPSTFDYSGNVYGVGMTIAGAYKHVFGSYDVNYTRSHVDLLNGRIPSITHGIRVGVLTNLGKVHAAFYTGGFRESIRGTLSGTGLIPNLNPDFSLTATPHQPWDALAGTSLEITSHFTVTAEGGFGGRKQFLISPGVRF
jgi:hypothetical protein